MLADALLADMHFLALFATFALLVTEHAMLSGPGGRSWQRIARVDLAYFIAAICILLTGFGRVFFGIKGAAYYWPNPFFHALWLSFLLIALLSIFPTLAFMRWKRRQQQAPAFEPAPAELGRVRLLLRIELGVFIVAPLFAVLMARGYGA